MFHLKQMIMRTIFTLLLLAVFTAGAYAQLLPLPATFEAGREDTAWHQFANAGDDPVNFGVVDNPDYSTINESDSCILFTVLENADPWVGAWADAYGPIEITIDNYMMEMWVHKDVISNCGLKLEAELNGGDNVEVMVANTLTLEWEKIVFDMSAAVGNTFQRLVFFPDFPETRESGSICYVDNIGFPIPVSVGEEQVPGIKLYPSPASDMVTVKYPAMERAVISNVLGQRVRSLELQGVDSKVVDLSGLTPGLYFMNLETADGPVSTKFLKK